MDLKKYSGFILPAIAALFVLFFYLSTTPASVYMGDDGETISCLKTLGIQHPPGYPLHTMAGSLFTALPVGDPSYRACLFSMAISLADFFLVYFIFSRLLSAAGLSAGTFLRLGAPLLFAMSYSVWEQSIIAKGGIYMLNIFFTLALSRILLEIYYKSKNPVKYFYLFAFTLGLSFSHHYMSQLVLIPAYGFLLFKSGIHKRLKAPSYAGALLLFLIGLTAYLYLPIRAVSAYLNWGDPSNWDNFVQVFTRWQYTRAEGTRSVIGSLRQALQFLKASSYAYAYAGAFFIIVGMVSVYKKDRNVFAYLISIPVIFLLITAVYLNLSEDRLYIMETYITPVYFPLSIFAAAGLVSMGAFISQRMKRLGKISAAAALIIIIGAQTLVFYPKLDKSSYFYVYDYNRNLYDSLDYNSMVFTAGDGVVFPSWYLKFVKHYRTDVTIIGSAVLPMKWVRDGIQKQNPQIRLPEIKDLNIGTESTGYIINALIRMNGAGYPVYFSYNKAEDNALAGGIKLMPKGIVFKALPEKFAVPSGQYIAALNNLWRYYNFRGVFGKRGSSLDSRTLNLYVRDYSVSLNSTGTFLEDAGMNQLSLEYFTKAHMFYPEDHEYVYNMGNGYYNTGNPQKAVEMYKQSVTMKPDYENAWFNLGVVSYGLKDYSQALQAFSKVKELDPSRTDLDPYISFIIKLNEIKQTPK
jgi:tetratricopeptide (TPR) repeat protein